jgi:hypothetical protein
MKKDPEFYVRFKTFPSSEQSIIPRRVSIWKITDGIWWLQIDINMKRPGTAQCFGSGPKGGYAGISFYDPDKPEDCGTNVEIHGIDFDCVLLEHEIRYGWDGILASSDALGCQCPVLRVEAKKRGRKWSASTIKDKK